MSPDTRPSLPEWTRSIRFRLTLLYSAVLFGIAALLVGALYMGIQWKLKDEALTNQVAVDRLFQAPDGTVYRMERLLISEARAFEATVNKNTLEQLRTFSFAGLGVLFVTSLGVGWIISGRVLSPIDDITDAARAIEATDLTQRIQLEGPDDELKRLADTFDALLGRIETAFGSQQRFVADASHELRNPLAVIRTNLDVALADDSATEEDLRRAATVARRAADRMARMVGDLLILARLGSTHPADEEFDLDPALQEVAEEFAALAAEDGIALTTTAESGLRLTGDRDAVKRIVGNLVENALQHSENSSRVAMDAGSESGWAWIAVADQGPGIEPEDHRRVFERFWRKDPSRERTEGGTGLGLSIVERLVGSHGGEIRLRSEVGRGSTFMVWLPGPDAAGDPPAGDPQLL